MDLNKIDLNGIEVIKKDDYYIIKRYKQYFRLGNNEAHIVQDLLDNKDTDYLLQKYNFTIENFNNFLSELQKVGIIGEIRKEKKNFLFYKVPLINPNNLLNKIDKIFFRSKIVNSFLLLIMTLTIILGLIQFGFNFFEIASSFLKGFGFKEYFLFYLATIGAVFLHEMGHAIVCKHYGGRVDDIGFILIFFSPALYCDVSGIWAFKHKKEKIITLLAGIFVQLMIFSVMQLLYSAFFNNSTWLATFIGWNLIMVVSNIIPVTKLDGYWLLSNIVDIPNLYEKSFKLALGIKKQVLFDEKERAKEKFIRLFGIFNMVFVFVSIILGFFGIYYLSITLEGPFKYVALTTEILIYSLTLIFFSIFLRKIIKLKGAHQKG